MPEEKRENFFTELLKFALVAVVIVLPMRLFVAQPFIVSGVSMVPTFEDAQYLIIDELTYHFSSPGRGDVIVFRYPKDPSQFFIKRIIGLPGDVVHIRGNNISVTKPDGSSVQLDESYVVNHGNGSDTDYTVPLDQYFVMGDNRPESSDSRIWGMLPRNDIVGRVFVRLLPIQQVGVFPGHHAEPQ
ncbi:MAG TPA: signal peptidase I [Candidatus Paceibacterota bacterium]|nr:signal peptidase I [Candidatus Paceibacterota bacterium]